MHFQKLSEDIIKSSSLLQVQEQVNEQKEQKAAQEIQNLERMWLGWLSSQIREEAPKKIETIEIECSQETSAVEKSQQLKCFFGNLKSHIIDHKLYTSLTHSQLTQFFEEATTQIQNKIKLFEDIQKLKLLSNYPTNTKRTYSKSANMILKKWLMENYNNPYPKPPQVDQLVQQTNLTNKQVIVYLNNRSQIGLLMLEIVLKISRYRKKNSNILLNVSTKNLHKRKRKSNMSSEEINNH